MPESDIALVEVRPLQDIPFYLAYVIICVRGSPFFFLYFPTFFYLSIRFSLNLELVPPCRIAIRNVTSLAIGLLFRCTSGAFLRVGSIGIRLRLIRCWCFSIGQYEDIALLLLPVPSEAVAKTSPTKILSPIQDRVGSIGIRMRPIWCWYFAIGQYDGVALPLCLLSRRATWRRPRRRPYQGYNVSKRSTSIGFTTQGVRYT